MPRIAFAGGTPYRGNDRPRLDLLPRPANLPHHGSGPLSPTQSSTLELWSVSIDARAGSLTGSFAGSRERTAPF